MKTLLILMGFLTVQGAFAQEYLLMIEDGTHTVQEIVDNAEAYFVDKDKGEDSEYVKFKRWEYMAYKLMDDQGYLTPITERIAQLEAYNAYSTKPLPQDKAFWRLAGIGSWLLECYHTLESRSGKDYGIAVDPPIIVISLLVANTGGCMEYLGWRSQLDPPWRLFSNLYVSCHRPQRCGIPISWIILLD